MIWPGIGTLAQDGGLEGGGRMELAGPLASAWFPGAIAIGVVLIVVLVVLVARRFR
jgi:hypothetical protein